MASRPLGILKRISRAVVCVSAWFLTAGARKGRSGGEVRQEALGALQHGEGWITDVEGRKVTRFVKIGTAFYPHPKRQDFPPPTT